MFNIIPRVLVNLSLNHPIMKAKIIVLTALIALVSTTATIAQCAMCRATVGSNLSEGRGVIGTGINVGIVYLLLMPYILVGALIFLWFRNGKKELKARQDLESRLNEIYKK